VKKLASWCVRHRTATIVSWVLALLVVTVLSQTIGSAFKNNFELPGTQSSDAYDILKAANPQVSGDVERIVFAVPAGQSVTDPAVKSEIEAMLSKIESFPKVGQVSSPYAEGAGTQISKNGRVAYATVTFSVQATAISTKQASHFVAIATAPANHDLTIAVSGQVAEQSLPQKSSGELPGILLALIVLLIVFGSLFAAGLPLISAVLSLGTATGVIALASHALNVPTFADQVVLLIGLGVGIDYALFIVTRHRQGLMAGRSTEDSIITAVDTSGRAVLFAGMIVCIALLGMLALQVGFLVGLAIAASIGVAFTMLAALTFIPALLAFIGPRVLSRRQRRSLAQDGPRIVGAGSKGFWPRWADFIQRRPLIPALLALLVVVLLATPFFGMRLGNADQGNDAVGTTTRTAYDLLADGFGSGFNGPLQLVAVTTSAQEQAAFKAAVDKVATAPGVATVTPAFALPSKDGKTVMLAQVFPTTSPQAAETTTLVQTLRSTTLPAATKGTGVNVLVGGITAAFVDYSDVLSSKLPLFVGIVVLFSFLLLAAVFRSILIPLTAAVMNLLSIGAAYGAMTAVFQHGVLGGVFGVSRQGPVEFFIPVMMFAILFGLSMDYEVFLVSRIHEEYLKTGDNATAVRNGLAATGKTITAAALIMILVFGSFIFGGLLVIKEFGVGLAVGVAVDALFIRMAIVPAVMQMLGKANWWYPHWLDRITPRLSVDPSEHAVSEPSPDLEGVSS
jgi:putative drug exporter of the RND superfamily